MPVLENSVNTRLEILKTIYRLGDQTAGSTIKLDAAQIDGAYYSEIHFQLRFLQDRGLVEFNENIVSRRFRVCLTDEGITFMNEAYRLLALPEEERSVPLKDLFQKIR